MDTDAMAIELTIPHEVRLLHHPKCRGRLFLFTEVPEAGNYYQCSCGRMFPLPSTELARQVIA
jgi:hypothetical protein